MTIKALFLGSSYIYIRRVVIVVFKLFRTLKRQAPDLEDAVLFGERRIAHLDKYLGWGIHQFSIPKHIEVEIDELVFPSPITFASYQGNIDIIHTWLKMGVGGGSLKTIMKAKREGNSRPRIQEIVVDGAITCINALGLPGPGIEGMLDMLKDSPIWSFNRPIGLSIGGDSLSDYVSALDSVEKGLNTQKRDCVYYEINISCPNTDEGQSILQNPHLLDQLISDLRKKTDRLISIKLSPDQSNEDILFMATIVESHPRMMITMGNTTYRSCEELGIPSNYISRGGGGLSGHPLLEDTLDRIERLSKVNVPIIATGGISSISSVNAAMSKGASLVGMATALIQNPYNIVLINNKLRH